MSDAETRQKLMHDLLVAVQQCQVRYGGKSELATENEEVVSKLCRSLEAVLAHGLKPKQGPSSALRQMTDLVSTNFSGFRTSSVHSSDSIPAVWSFVKVHLNRHELERYMLLKFINTDVGRGRAWIRASLNEHSLERYIHLFLGDLEILEQHYESWAFIRDEERNAMLPSMAAGLGSILFAITIDNLVLNTSTDPFSKIQRDESNILATVKKTTPSTSSEVNVGDDKVAVGKKKKKSKKVSAKIVDFDETDVGKMREHRELSVSASSDTRSETSAKSSTSKIVESDKTSPTQSISYDPVRLKDSVRKTSLNKSTTSKSIDTEIDEETDADIYSRSSVDESDQISAISADGKLSALTPIRNVEIGALIPLSANGEVRHDVQSEDSASVHSFGEESDYGSVFTDLPQTAIAKSEIHHQPAKSLSSSGSAISREDLKQALLSVMSRKDELQSQCSALKKLLEQEASTASGLQEELKESRRKVSEVSEKLSNRIQTLTRENELLKHQLKKYVGAVQKLRDGPMAYETLAHLEGQSAAAKAENSTKYVDYHFEASEFEKKLIQVAEMHGELLEFNEHLQKTIQAKDSYIRRLRDELVELRGPLPNGEGDQQEDTVSLLSEAESMTASIISTASQSGRLSLINIWIPSVFLSGNANRTHHVYQVYLKIGTEEWNIYRRYSEFYALHKDLQHRDRSVSGFDFPPKKTVGYKAEKVVEDRRKRLQAYLRSVVNLMIQKNPGLLAKPDKEHVLLLMPFFAESSSRMGHTAASPSMLTNAGSGHRLFQRQGRRGVTRNALNSTPQLAL